MKKSELVFTRYRPLMAVDTKLIDRDADPTDTTRVYSLCRICDGSHEKHGFQGRYQVIALR